MLRLSSSLVLLASLSLAACSSAQQDSDNFHNHLARKLQGLPTDLFGPDGTGICVDDTTVNFQEQGISQGFAASGFEAAVFAEEFEPICTCEEDSNIGAIFELQEEFEAQLSGNSSQIPDIGAFFEELNEVLGTIALNTEYNCYNQCETCLDETKEVCAIVQSVQSTSFALKPGNFNISDLGSLSDLNDLSGNGPAAFTEFVDELDFKYGVCLTYTRGSEGLVGNRACMLIQIDETQDFDEEVACDLSYKGVSCESCTVSAGCVKATCSEDSSGGAVSTKDALLVDTCAGTGLEGPYQFMQFLTNDANITTLAKGDCTDFDDLPEIVFPDKAQSGGSSDGQSDEPSEPSGESSAPAASNMAVIVGFIVAMFL